MSDTERITALEKRVAALEKQIQEQPDKIISIMVERLQNTSDTGEVTSKKFLTDVCSDHK